MKSTFSEKKHSNDRNEKKTREELYLPKIHYIAVDDWMKKLGKKTFCYWLELLTLVDRTPEGKEKFGNYSTVPRSFENLYNKVFKISSPTFYNNIIKPLWNYGLIDIRDWKESSKIGTKPKNINVYEYPKNSPELAKKPLKKFRDYDKDYSSVSAKSGRLGGKLRQGSGITAKNEKGFTTKGKEDLTLSKINKSYQIPIKIKGKNNLTLTVKNSSPLRFKKIKAINYTNTRVNRTNARVNSSNKKEFEEEEKINDIKTQKPEKYDQDKIMDDFQIDRLIDHLNKNGFHESQIKAIVKLLEERKIFSFTPKVIDRQIAHMSAEMKNGNLSFSSKEGIASYFVNGLMSLMTQSKIVNIHERKKMIKEQERFAKSINRDTSVYYNWLEE